MKLIDELLRIAKHPTYKYPDLSDRYRERDARFFMLLQATPVYEISNVVQLIDNNVLMGPIPKRPPHCAVWCEYKYSIQIGDEHPNVPVTVGWWLVEHTNITSYVQWMTGNRERSDTFLKDCGGFAHYYVCSHFMKLEAPLPERRAPRGAIYMDPRKYICCMDDQFIKPHWTYYDNEHFDDPEVHAWTTLFGLPFVQGAIRHPWGAIGAFALLHCKNIETETITPPEKLQKATIRRGHLPLITYKVLKLEASYQAPRHAPEDTGGAPERHHRFHLVRGHFKNLQSDRFREKGWHWWPAHCRGDAELGRVEKSYEVHADHVAHTGS